MDPINWDIIRYILTDKTLRYLQLNRDNPREVSLNNMQGFKELQFIIREIDEDGKQTSPLVDALVDKLVHRVQMYASYGLINTQYTLKRRLLGRTDINLPCPEWCTPRVNNKYEISDSHDGILSSAYITSSAIEVYNQKYTGALDKYYKT